MDSPCSSEIFGDQRIVFNGHAVPKVKSRSFGNSQPGYVIHDGEMPYGLNHVRGFGRQLTVQLYWKPR